MLARKKEREAQAKETVWEAQLRKQRERKKAKRQGTQAGAEEEGAGAAVGGKGDKGAEGKTGKKGKQAEEDDGFDDDFFKGEGPTDWDAEMDSDEDEEAPLHGRAHKGKAAAVVAAVPAGKAAKEAARLAKVRTRVALVHNNTHYTRQGFSH